MKKLLAVLLIIMCAFISACGVNAGNNGKKKVNFKNYLLQENKRGEGEYLADFDLKQYLIDYGATNITRAESPADGSLVVSVRFENDVIVTFVFGPDSNDYSGYGYLRNMYIMMGDKDFIPENWNVGYPTAGIHSDWERIYMSTEDMMPQSFNWDTYKLHSYVLTPSETFYMTNLLGGTSLVSVPDFFDEGFKRTVVPYISLDKVSFRVDPFEDSADVGGYTEYD